MIAAHFLNRFDHHHKTGHSPHQEGKSDKPAKPNVQAGEAPHDALSYHGFPSVLRGGAFGHLHSGVQVFADLFRNSDRIEIGPERAQNLQTAR